GKHPYRLVSPRLRERPFQYIRLHIWLVSQQSGDRKWPDAQSPDKHPFALSLPGPEVWKWLCARVCTRIHYKFVWSDLPLLQKQICPVEKTAKQMLVSPHLERSWVFQRCIV